VALERAGVEAGLMLTFAVIVFTVSCVGLVLLFVRWLLGQ
jgi:hypothetical protein